MVSTLTDSTTLTISLATLIFSFFVVLWPSSGIALYSDLKMCFSRKHGWGFFFYISNIINIFSFPSCTTWQLDPTGCPFLSSAGYDSFICLHWRQPALMVPSPLAPTFCLTTRLYCPELYQKPLHGRDKPNFAMRLTLDLSHSPTLRWRKAIRPGLLYAGLLLYPWTPRSSPSYLSFGQVVEK